MDDVTVDLTWSNAAGGSLTPNELTVDDNPIPAKLIQAKRQELERPRIARKVLSDLRSMFYSDATATNGNRDD